MRDSLRGLTIGSPSQISRYGKALRESRSLMVNLLRIYLNIVLQKPSSGIPSRAGKNPKKGDWEAELRAELEKKKGALMKLSVKDQALINEQLAKESAIRSKVEEARQALLSGLGIVQSLINIPSALSVELWFYKALTMLLGGVVQKCGAIVGTAAADAYLVIEITSCAHLKNMSSLMTYRLGLYKAPIGVALLRSVGVMEIPENWSQEALHGESLPFTVNIKISICGSSTESGF